MTPLVKLRPARHSDVDFAREAHHLAYRDVVERQFGPWDEAAQDQFFASAWDPDQTEVLLLDGEPIGYCSVELRDRDLHLRELVVHPTYQGRGAGTWLIRHIQNLAIGAGQPVRLGTFLENRAMELYRRLGFDEIGATDTHVLMEWRPTRQPPGS